MNDYDRFDFFLSMLTGAGMTAVLLLGGPAWTLVPIGMVCCTIVLYRHLDLPPRRKRHQPDRFTSLH